MVEHTLENSAPWWEIHWDQESCLPTRKELIGGSFRLKRESDDCRKMSWNEEHFRAQVHELTLSRKKMLSY